MKTMSVKSGGDGDDTIVELSKGRMLNLGTKCRWALRIISSGST
jgi:hypothetical protein